jgi:hypothetical protein
MATTCRNGVIYPEYIAITLAIVKGKNQSRCHKNKDRLGQSHRIRPRQMTGRPRPPRAFHSLPADDIIGLFFVFALVLFS